MAVLTAARMAVLTAGPMAARMVVLTAARMVVLTAARMVVLTARPMVVLTAGPMVVLTAAPMVVLTAAPMVVLTAGPMVVLTVARMVARMARLTVAPAAGPERHTARTPGRDDRVTDSEMTSGTAGNRRPALARLLAMGPAEFAEKHWGTAPLLSTASELDAPFDDLFSNDAVDELITTRGLRTPFLRVAKDGRTLGDAEFTAPGGVGAAIRDQLSDDRLLRLFAEGSTLVLQGLHRTWAPLIEFAAQLGTDLGHPVQVNAYVTPAQSTGFSSHYDVHDVFVIQIAGQKQWQIREPVLTLPLRTQPWEHYRAAVARAAQEQPLLDVTLSPGDVLYLPRGYLHAATALGDISTHLTIGIHAWTRHHLLEHLITYAVARLADDPEVRRSLPMFAEGTEGERVPATDFDLVRDRLIAVLADATPAEVREQVEVAHRAGQRAAPVAPIASVVSAGTLGLDDTLTLRPYLAAALTDPNEDGAAQLLSRAGRFAMAAHERAGVERLLADGAIAVRESGIELARRLVLSGIATLDQR